MNVLSLFDGMSCGQIALNQLGIKYDKYFACEIDKHAIQVTQANYPDTIQLGDVTKVKGSDLPKIDLLIGGSPCFVKNTKVITKQEYKNIQDVKVGDLVITHTGKFQKVLRIGNEKSNTVVVKAQGIKPTETTYEHPYYVRSVTRKRNNQSKTYYREFSNPYWKKAIDLTKGDFIGININQISENPLGLTEEECYILGRYIADGHTIKGYRISEGRPEHRKWGLILSIGFKKINDLKSKINDNHYSCYEHTKSVYRVVFSNKRLVEIAEKYCGCGAINKIIPQIFINLPVKLLEMVLEGYLDGDGSYRNDTYRANSISENLIMTLSQAIAKVYRVNSSYEYSKRPEKHMIEGRLVNQNDTYTLTFRKEMKKQSNAVVIDNIIWLPVKSVFKTSNTEIVYNLEVENDNSYTANNAIVHNCQGFSFSGKQLAFDDPRSKLFFEYVRLLKECNPKYFLLENVRMKKEYEKVITDYLGIEPIQINSSLVSAQNRVRLYWTNIYNKPFGLFGKIKCMIPQPEDKGILLKDILEKNHTLLSQKAIDYCNNAKFNQDKVIHVFDKCIAITTSIAARTFKNEKGIYFKLTPLECERLQTVNTLYELEVNLCLDQAKNYVNVVEKNHKLQKLVSNVEKKELSEFAKLVEKSMKQSNQQIKFIVPQNADMQIQKQIKKCTRNNQNEKHINVNTAGKKTMFSFQDIEGDFAVQSVFTNIIQETITSCGKEALRPKDKTLYQVQNGKKLLKLCGREIMQLVNVVGITTEVRETEKCIYTILYRLNTKSIEQMLIILYWFAKNVITLSTQIKTSIKNLLLNYRFENSYTAHVSDSQRYKMLGNGWTVDVIKHILGYMDK